LEGTEFERGRGGKIGGKKHEKKKTKECRTLRGSWTKKTKGGGGKCKSVQAKRKDTWGVNRHFI